MTKRQDAEGDNKHKATIVKDMKSNIINDMIAVLLLHHQYKKKTYLLYIYYKNIPPLQLVKLL